MGGGGRGSSPCPPRPACLRQWVPPGTHLLACSAPVTNPPQAGLPLSPCSLAAHRVFWQGRCRTAAPCGEVQHLLRSLSHGGWPKPPHSSAPPARGAAGGCSPVPKTSPYWSPAWARSGRLPVQWWSLYSLLHALGTLALVDAAPIRPPIVALARGRCWGWGGEGEGHARRRGEHGVGRGARAVWGGGKIATHPRGSMRSSSAVLLRARVRCGCAAPGATRALPVTAEVHGARGGRGVRRAPSCSAGPKGDVSPRLSHAAFPRAPSAPRVRCRPEQRFPRAAALVGAPQMGRGAGPKCAEAGTKLLPGHPRCPYIWQECISVRDMAVTCGNIAHFQCF